VALVDALANLARFILLPGQRHDSVGFKPLLGEATCITIEVVKKRPDQVGFQNLPRPWVVERFFAGINRNRRLAKDFEATIALAQAFLYAASVMLLTRRLARAA